MEKRYIKVSRDAAKVIKNLSEDVKEYIGATLNAAVNNECFGWEDVEALTASELIDMVLESNGCETIGQLEEKAGRFCWSCGYIGYKLQSRF